MSWGAMLAEQILLAGIAGRTSPSRHGLAIWVLGAVTGLLSLAGFTVLVVAGHMYLESVYGETTATAITGFALLGLAFLGALITSMLLSRSRNRNKVSQKIVAEKVERAVETVIDEFEEPVRENPKTAAAVAVLAGYAAAKRFM